uniref:Radical SAM protein n=1 Tax=Thermofilum pendens TaxID=2269 RepID=A0A7J3X6P6_THEPE
MLYERVAVRLSELAEKLVVSASCAMSLHCYSVLRLDPYVGCGHGCIYCFTKLLPRYPGGSSPLWGFPRALDRVLAALKETPVASMPFRMSALTDPLQPLEKRAKLGLAVLEVARHRRIPLLLSTKSVLAVEPPWFDAVKEHAGEGGLVVQITLITLSEEKSKALEPGAPSPEERLRAVEKLASESVPVVVRLQPLIPFVNDDSESLEELIDQVATAGARQVIAEYYRFSSWGDLEMVARAADPRALRLLARKELWEKYPTGTHKRPRREYRIAKYKLVRDLASRRSLLFSTCREGLYDLDTAPDCCGIHFMRKYRLRPTLREYTVGLHGSLYISREELVSIPIAALRRRLLEHYKYLERYVAKELNKKNHAG